VTRSQNLFQFAHLCHLSPPQVDDLRLGDFANLLSGIRQYEAASKPQPERSGR
jgi:hypothetical protein